MQYCKRNSRAVSALVSSALAVLGTTCVVAQPPSAVVSSPLRYRWKAGQVFAYEVEITADRNAYVDKMKGVISYSVKGVEGKQLRVEYRGGLKRDKEMKPGQSSGTARPGLGPRFGRRGGPRGFGGPRGPFDSVPFKGLTTTTNNVTLTPQGEIQRIEGDSQLPYLLGNLSILVFEPLPEDARSDWSVGSGVTITEGKGRRSGPPRFGGPRAFARDDPEKRTAGSEGVSMSVQSDDGRLVTASKQYHLDSPVTDGQSFQITGNGTWAFNRELGVSESLDVTQQLVVQQGSTTVTVPVTVKYRRLSEDELRAHQAEQQKQQEAMKQRLAEMQQKRAKKPLGSQDKNEILYDLQSDKWATALRALQRLNNQTPDVPDRRIAAAVEALLGHKNPLVRQAAEKAAAKWGPSGAADAGAGGDSSQDSSPSTQALRTWSDDTGQFKIEAEFLGLADGNVRLRRTDGREITVPLSRLSPADQKAAHELSKKTGATSNPFDP